MEREKLLDKIKKAIYFSILIDGATDSATLENELIYVRFLATDGPVNAYLSIQDVKHGNANGILDAIHAGTIGMQWNTADKSIFLLLSYLFHVKYLCIWNMLVK